ncbi:CCR4-NOT transcription complex subunit 10 isoform X2 [Scaptodrosophila lebanonensis]|uniref:CCR4-NOT transcription complex subunit 10 n=1 Tax=Drosophila lebanonensis TaxID=7225 RepID=A0A6J2T5R2_DROLE|nr:CCR4-NOT transcription complex subunit 10 isoform X2 [Scaptodrosophila lebanonensis]
MGSADSPTKTQANEDENYNILCHAHEQFSNGEYDRCLELMQQLESTEESSGSILRHNRAVVHYYKSGCTEHAALLKELEELDPDPSPSLSSTEGLSLKHSGSGATVARYNKSVIYYHRHMYATALEKLAPLVNRLDALEKHMAALTATLQLQLLLATNQLNRAEAFLDYLQRKLNFVSSVPSISSNSGASPSVDETATTTAQTSSTVATPATSPDSAMAPAVRLGGDVSGTLQLLQLLTHVLNRKPVVVPEDGTPQFAALKAHQYYIMKDFQMAAKQLMRINNDCSQSGVMTQLSTCIANNMGVIHLRVRHYALAAKFFQNALTFDKQLASNLRQSTLQTMSSARSCEILYNLGISMLHLRRPKEAFQCFLVPVKLYHSNPRLWFRMAEACIMEHEEKLLVEERESLNDVASSAATSFAFGSSSKSYGAQSAAVPEPTLEFAALCLRSALTLTLHYKTSFHIAPSQEEMLDERPHWRQVQDNNFCNPSKPISLESLENMLAAIYAAYSFVSLRLGDHVTALEMADELLKTDRLSDAHKLLGHMYAGEALMYMDKPADARDHLEPTFVSTLNAFDFETRDWQVKSLDAAQQVVRYNLAVAMTLQNDFKAAKSLLISLTHSIVTAKALSLRRYIDAKLSSGIGTGAANTLKS